MFDQHVYSDGNQAVIWAIGPLNSKEEVSYHRLRSKGNLFIDFARTPKWNCPNSSSGSSNSRARSVPMASQPAASATSVRHQEPASSSVAASLNSAISPSTVGATRSPDSWQIPPIICPADNTFRAQIGPTGGSKGYSGITGRTGWGIAWYVNGLLIPELTVERGKTYTFIVEGGNDKQNSARNHPLYITDSAEGGFHHKSDDERRKERIFAGIGITRSGELVPTAAGRSCEWVIDPKRQEKPETFKDFFDYQKTLTLQCQGGEPAILRWRPDRNTPDTVYYQCYTHRYLGWRIRVVDSCDQSASASMTKVYHTSAENSTSWINKNAQSLVYPNRKQSDEATSRRGILGPKTGRISDQENLNLYHESLRLKANRPILNIGPVYSPFYPPRVQPIMMPDISANVYRTPINSPFTPIGPVRPLDMHLSSSFGSNPMKKTPIYVSLEPATFPSIPSFIYFR